MFVLKLGIQKIFHDLVGMDNSDSMIIGYILNIDEHLNVLYKHKTMYNF
jgi:hypothetical protein